MKNLLKNVPGFITIIFLFTYSASYAQELNCTVSVNDRQISGSSFNYISELKNDLESYINQNRWTDDRFEERERIACIMQIVLTDADDQFNYTAEVILSVRRPVYNTNRLSVSIVLSDSNWNFHYPRNKNLIRDELQFDDLTSFIDFYAYVILGYDYDTFSPLGGSRYFNQALSIFEMGQATGSAGWTRSIGAQRNRYGLITDLTNSGYSGFREAVYLYHRLGLDQFTLNPELSRNAVLESLKQLREVKRVTSNNYLFDLFFSTKYNEIVAIFRDTDVQTRLEAYNVLRDVDPANTSAYEPLQN
ncbi:MAG: DUF4835 family protein [Balneolaceae bacterium]